MRNFYKVASAVCLLCSGLSLDPSMAQIRRAFAPFSIDPGHTYDDGPIAFSTLAFNMSVLASPLPNVTPSSGQFVFKPKTISQRGGTFQITFPKLRDPLHFECEIGRSMPFLVTISLTSGAITKSVSTTILPGKVGNYLTFDTPKIDANEVGVIILEAENPDIYDWNMYGCIVS